MLNNAYEVLGIREGASMDEIKRAYRRKAKEYHPDLHPNDPKANERMQQINEAYDMLCNPDKYRAQQTRTNPDPYAGYGQRAYDDYARRGKAYNQGGWQYTYYNADSQDAWQAWQQAWNQSSGAQRQQQSTRMISPFRGVARFLLGLMAFRFVISILRIMLFGFLR